MNVSVCWGLEDNSWKKDLLWDVVGQAPGRSSAEVNKVKRSLQKCDPRKTFAN